MRDAVPARLGNVTDQTVTHLSSPGRARRPPVSPDHAGQEDRGGRKTCRAFGRRRRGRDDVLRASACDPRPGSHVDNYLAAVRTRSPAGLLAALPVNGIQPGNRGGPPGSSPATSHAPHRHPAYFHSSPATLVHSPYTRDLAGAGVIGACSHAGPGSQAALRFPPRCAILTIWTTPTSSNGCWPYRHTQEASSGIHAWPDQCLARVHGRAHKKLRAEFPGPPAIPARSATSTRPRSRSKRASHALAVHEPQQHYLPGHREALGRTPPETGQQQPGYGQAVLVATHLPAEPASQDHEDSHFPLRIEGTLPWQSL